MDKTQKCSEKDSSEFFRTKVVDCMSAGSLNIKCTIGIIFNF